MKRVCDLLVELERKVLALLKWQDDAGEAIASVPDVVRDLHVTGLKPVALLAVKMNICLKKLEVSFLPP